MKAFSSFAYHLNITRMMMRSFSMMYHRSRVSEGMGSLCGIGFLGLLSRLPRRDFVV
jgi:hypothetical protein